MKKSWNGHSGTLLAEKDNISVINCECCQYIHIVPLPKQEEKAEFYEKEFYEKFSDDYIIKHQKDEAWWQIEHNEKYDKFESLIGQTNQSKRILDVGSGPGYFLKVGAERGCQVVGIEPGTSAWRYSTEILGLTVHNSYLTSQNAHEFGEFDVVHLNNVLEHIVDADNFLKIVRTLVKPSGLIAITVPNDFNPLQKIVVDNMQKDSWWVSPLQHINYFNMDTLEQLLVKNLFEPAYKTGSFPMELFLLMGTDYIGDSVKGRDVHRQRKQFELIMEKSGRTDLKRKMYDALSVLGLGRQITVISKKSEC